MSDRQGAKNGADDTGESIREFVTATIGSQLCGIPVLKVQDVLGPQRITPIPLAPIEVAGSLNLRGRIVTAIDLRTRMGLTLHADEKNEMSIVVEHHHELYSLMVDSVGEVLKMSMSNFERNPATLDSVWRGFSEGVYRLPEGLLVVLDVETLLDFGQQKDAA